MDDRLEKHFDSAMMEIYRRAKSEANYTASIFHRMLSERGGLATAKQLINDANVSQGYTALWERGRLDLTVEAVVSDNAEWWPLFDADELARARKRLPLFSRISLRRCMKELRRMGIDAEYCFINDASPKTDGKKRKRKKKAQEPDAA